MLITKLLNVVSQSTGLECHYGSRERLNDELDDATFPCAFVFLMNSGAIDAEGGQICESANVSVFVVDKTDYDFDTIENAEIIDSCKQRIDRLIFGLYGSDTVKLNAINNTTQLYDEFDVILTGYAVELNVSEIYGTACVGGVIPPEPHPFALQDKTVTPMSIQQIITADEGFYGLGKVTVEAGGVLQEKSVEVVENGETEITPDEGFDGMSKVTLTTNVPVPSVESEKTISITENGTTQILPSSGFDAMANVEVNVDVPVPSLQAMQTYVIDKDNASQVPVIIEPSEGYDAMQKTAVDVVVSPVVIEPTTSTQVVTPTSQNLAYFDGVTVQGVTSAIDSNIQAQNIKKDVTILGVTGTFEGGGYSPLPEGYTLKEYIMSDGSAYINTNLLYFNDFDRIITKIIGGVDYPSSGVYLYGNGRNGSNSGIYLCFVGDIFYTINNSWQWRSTGVYCVENTEYLVTHSKGGIMINDTASVMLASNTRSDRFYIFYTPGGSAIDKYSKIKEMYLYNGEQIVSHFYPCTNSNNIAGLYDTISNTFFTNSGSGNFIVG